MYTWKRQPESHDPHGPWSIDTTGACDGWGLDTLLPDGIHEAGAQDLVIKSRLHGVTIVSGMYALSGINCL